MNLDKISSLGRPLDITYKTNALIASLSLVILIVITLYAALAGIDESWPEALVTGVVAAASVFLCWALARELDPDHQYAAFWGCAVIIAYMLYAGRFSPNLVAALFLLLQTRALARTTGPSPAQLPAWRSPGRGPRCRRHCWARHRRGGTAPRGCASRQATQIGRASCRERV